MRCHESGWYSEYLGKSQNFAGEFGVIRSVSTLLLKVGVLTFGKKRKESRPHKIQAARLTKASTHEHASKRPHVLCTTKVLYCLNTLEATLAGGGWKECPRDRPEAKRDPMLHSPHSRLCLCRWDPPMRGARKAAQARQSTCG